MTVLDLDLTRAVTRALRAPSVHNTQPWRWRIRPGAVELHADPDRRLNATDPDGRDVLLSCGAALQHLRVALAAEGTAVTVERLPDPDDRHHLATVRPVPGPADASDAALAPSIERRRTDRRRMSDTPPSDGDVAALVETARRAGAMLVPVTGAVPRERLATLLAAAAREQAAVPGYAAELHLWSRRWAGARDGVPGRNVAVRLPGPAGPTPLRRFPGGSLAQPASPSRPGPDGDGAVLLAVVTDRDGTLDRLRAGEAAGAVLLDATRRRLATTPLSQGIEVEPIRRLIARTVLHVPEEPHLLLRVGHPAAPLTDLPQTPRRELRFVLLSGPP